jgi:protein-S-isoprenylcysteine O-methyltransferase Ste14
MPRWLEHRIPPPVIDASFALAMWGIARLLPGLSADWPGRVPASVALALAGAMVSLAGVLAFRRQRTTVNPLKPQRATSLVATGIYRFTRNPMYLGMLVVLVAWALYLSNLAAAALVPLFVPCLNRLQILPEERVLRAKFGAAFDDYVARVRRWI